MDLLRALEGAGLIEASRGEYPTIATTRRGDQVGVGKLDLERPRPPDADGDEAQRAYASASASVRRRDRTTAYAARPKRTYVVENSRACGGTRMLVSRA